MTFTKQSIQQLILYIIHYITICVYQKYDGRGHKNKKVHGLLICEVY